MNRRTIPAETAATTRRLRPHRLRGVDGASLSRVLDDLRGAVDACDIIWGRMRAATQRIRDAVAQIAKVASAAAETADDHATAHAARGISQAASDLLIDLDAVLADAQAFDFERIFATRPSPNGAGAGFDLDALFPRPVRRSPHPC